MGKKQDKILQKTVDEYEMLYPILDSLYEEVKEFSKKKQDGVLNETKVKMVNRILVKVKVILKDDPTIEFLDLLDEVTLPTNSDAVMIITQFKAAMVQFKERNRIWTGTRWTWNVEK